jgi:hypothetical protein
MWFLWNYLALHKLPLVLSDASCVGAFFQPKPTFNEDTFEKLFKNRIIFYVSQERRLKTYSIAVIRVSTFVFLFFDNFLNIRCNGIYVLMR